MSLDPAEVPRIIDAGMARPDGDWEWLERLSQPQLIEECEKRGLLTSGIVPTLRARIRKYERRVAEVREELSSENEMAVPRLRNGGSLDGLPSAASSSPARGDARGASQEPLGPRPDLAAAREAGEESTPLRRPPMMAGAIPRDTRYRAAWRPERNLEQSARLAPLEIGKWMKQWNISFSGARGADADAFVRKVRRLRAVAPVSDRDLLLCLPFYLQGLALSWFEEKQARIHTWPQFEESFSQRFAMQGSRSLIGEEIRRRTQGECEPVADYLACMYALLRRLTPPWSEQEKLDRLHQNVLPCIQMWIPRRQVRDID